MYISLRSKHLEFHLLCRCAPVAVDSGLRPETHNAINTLHICNQHEMMQA